MGEAYDAKLKSRIADMMNVGGRDGGAITAAQFLRAFRQARDAVVPSGYRRARRW